MIIETTTFVDGLISFDDRSMVCVSMKHNTKQTAIFIYGKEEPLLVEMEYADALEIFKKAQSRDRFTDTEPRKSEHKKFNEVTVGAHKFKIDIGTTEYEDGKASDLILCTNFEIKNEALKEVIKSVTGVDATMTYLMSRYETSISIGKMFDAEWVRQNLENQLIMFLDS